MEYLNVMASMLWAPQSVSSNQKFQNPNKKLFTGFFLGLIGLIIRMIWIVPDNLIRISENPTLELFLNKVAGFGFGLVFALFMLIVESIYLRLWKIFQPTFAVAGSMAIYIFLPLIGNPIHALFPEGLSASGYSYIVWILIVFFVSWHSVWLGLLCKNGNIEYRADINKFQKKIPYLVVILTIFEIAITFLLFYYLPLLFNSTYNEFFMVWL